MLYHIATVIDLTDNASGSMKAVGCDDLATPLRRAAAQTSIIYDISVDLVPDLRNPADDDAALCAALRAWRVNTNSQPDERRALRHVINDTAIP